MGRWHFFGILNFKWTHFNLGISNTVWFHLLFSVSNISWLWVHNNFSQMASHGLLMTDRCFLLNFGWFLSTHRCLATCLGLPMAAFRFTTPLASANQSVTFAGTLRCQPEPVELVGKPMVSLKPLLGHLFCCPDWLTCTD